MYKGSAVLQSVTRQSALTKQLATLQAANKTTALISSFPARSGKLYTTSRTLNNNNASEDKDTHLNNNPFAPLARQSYKKATEQQQQQAHGPVMQHVTTDKAIQQVLLQESNHRIKELADRHRHGDAIKLFLAKTKDGRAAQLNASTYEAVVASYGSLLNKNEPLTAMMNVYDHMIANGVRPTSKTYAILIKNLCARDAEVNRASNVLRRQIDVHSSTSAEKNVISQVSKEALTKDGNMLQSLEAEQNIQRAVAVFEQAVKDKSTQAFDVALYNNLLRGLSYVGNTQDGLFIYEQLENGRVRPNSTTFAMLMSMFGTAGDLKAVRECFSEYKSLSRGLPSHDPAYVYNALVFAHVNAGDLQGALRVIEKVMVNDGVPVSISPYNRILYRACMDGDMALVSSLVRRLETDDTLPKPDANTYGVLLSTYSRLNQLDDAHHAFDRLVTLSLHRQYGHLSEYIACCLNAHQYDRVLDVMQQMARNGMELDTSLCSKVISAAIASNDMDRAAHTATQIIKLHAKSNYVSPSSPVVQMAMNIVEKTPMLTNALDVLQALQPFGVRPADNALVHLADLYAPQAGQLDALRTTLAQHSPNRVFSYLFDAARTRHASDMDAYQATVNQLLHDLHALGARANSADFERVAAHFAANGATDQEQAWRDAVEAVYPGDKANHHKKLANKAAEAATISRIVEDMTMDRHLYDAESDQALQWALKGEFDQALDVVRNGMLAKGKTPSPELVRDMIQKANKMNQVDAAMSIHDVIAPAFEAMPEDETRRVALGALYNNMLIAHARALDLESAKVYYDKLRQLQLFPDADAYGSLLTCTVHDTTDESLDAMVIYEEARKHHVKPTVYFYNVILSKLSKCRKKDKVLAMFDEMQQLGVAPNAITYANVISACLRCSAESQAVRFFDDMITLPKYQPRIGVYNAFIQYYVEQKQDRGAALKFFQLLKQHKLVPSAHTYKLLIQAYASIPAFDMVTAHSMLNDMKKRYGMQPTATHYATLVRSYGCLHRDVASAEAVYNEMNKAGVAPNDLVYQAMLDTYIEHGMMQKAEALYTDMASHNVKSSAYIENLFIRGYGAQDQVDKAEAVFDRMTTREPSTYEAMVRVYVESNLVDKAKSTIEQMKTRLFPQKVVEGVSALLV
ncbi:hypothetical protein BC940DRAFT_347024 [Gongronella butleri]|nr:hypothetical protein BC940DRAFT_347024 [Gongronella butleri]